jgi:hypothetical protein
MPHPYRVVDNISRFKYNKISGYVFLSGCDLFVSGPKVKNATCVIYNNLKMKTMTRSKLLQVMIRKYLLGAKGSVKT